MEAAAFGYVQQLVKDHAGIVVESCKEYLAQSRLTSVAREQGFATLEQLVAQLRGQPFAELHRRLVEAFTINETSFFRDQRPFDALRTTILPQLARSGRQLTIWCAAASSGQEPYSIAMLVREHYPQLASRTRIIASDLSREMIARTNAGVYSQFEVGRGLSASAIKRFMTPVAGGWQVVPELRAMVETREINLARPLPALPEIDVLFARNVLIYFDVATRQTTLNRMKRVLAPDGVLILGGGESLLDLDVELARCPAATTTPWYRHRA
ncbi:MAG: protein-glutamate O-methyltransferase CheR [Kofleriaceae bacterium]